MFKRLGLVAPVLICLVLLAPNSASARAATGPTVPSGFIGMNLDDPLFPNTTSVSDLESQLGLMVASGVETLHVPFYWSNAQPYRKWSEIPADQHGDFANVGGIPTNFSSTDQLIGEAAARGITIVPTVLAAPSWDGKRSGKYGVIDVPRKDSWYANYLKGLIARYGPGGTFWSANLQLRRVPITMWQVWNEPNLQTFWPELPWAPTYVALLATARWAIKHADPHAKVVLAGLTNFSWDVLNTLYTAGGGKDFDVAAVHPYTKQPRGAIAILQKVRSVMAQHGDGGKSIIADEFGWPSSIGQTNENYTLDFGTTEAGQASKLATMLRLFARDRRALKLIGIDYYTWVSIPTHNGNVFDFAGLLSYTDGDFVAKPALKAFSRQALSLEHCRKKGTFATSCAKPS